MWRTVETSYAFDLGQSKRMALGALVSHPAETLHVLEFLVLCMLMAFGEVVGHAFPWCCS